MDIPEFIHPQFKVARHKPYHYAAAGWVGDVSYRDFKGAERQGSHPVGNFQLWVYFCLWDGVDQVCVYEVGNKNLEIQKRRRTT